MYLLVYLDLHLSIMGHNNNNYNEILHYHIVQKRRWVYTVNVLFQKVL